MLSGLNNHADGLCHFGQVKRNKKAGILTAYRMEVEGRKQKGRRRKSWHQTVAEDMHVHKL